MTEDAAFAVEVPVGEARPLGISQYSTATESEVRVLLVKLALLGLEQTNTTRLDDATVAKAVGEGRPLEIADLSASALSPGEAASARPGEKVNAGVTAVARLAGEARSLGIAKHSTKTESNVAVFFGLRVKSTPSAFDTAVAMPADEARPSGIAEQSATTDSVTAVSSGEAGLSTAGVVLAGEAWPSGIAQQNAMMKPELAETSGEVGPFRSRVNEWCEQRRHYNRRNACWWSSASWNFKAKC